MQDATLSSLKEIVNPTESTDKEAARRRLQELVELYSLDEHLIKGDGNCQFRALSDQLYRTPKHHEQVRADAIEQFRKHPDLYS